MYIIEIKVIVAIYYINKIFTINITYQEEDASLQTWLMFF